MLRKTRHKFSQTNARRWPKWMGWLKLVLLTSIAAILLKAADRDLQHLFQPLERWISQLEAGYQQWGSGTSNPGFLVPFAFGGGLLASISPCILAMLPVNLSYIGTLEVKSRWQAFRTAAGFVCGAVTVFSVFGLFSGVAGAIMVDWRGYINLAVGALIILMGLSFGGVFHLPLPRQHISFPPLLGTYGVGATFALVSSPCASPVLFAVLSAAATTGSPLWSGLVMVAYALGYTTLIFAASLFAGAIKLTRRFLVNADTVIWWGAFALIIMGGYYVVSGILWFL